IDFKLRSSFELLDIVSITVNGQHDLDKLNSLDIVRNIRPVSIVERPKAADNQITNPISAGNQIDTTNPISADELTGVAEVRAQTNYTGKNIKVGIIDTGIDYTHPAFGNCYKTKGCKIQFGYDFVGDAFNGTNTPQSDDDPLDQYNGHGTHVAGIIAADDKIKNFTGVAPGVTLGIYRIFGCNGTTNIDLTIKAMERAYNDGMVIINLSLEEYGWSESLVSVAAEKLISKRLVVIIASGNDGQGIFQTSSPGVTSVDNSKVQSYYLTISSSPDKKFTYTTTQFNISGNPEIVATSDNTKVTDDACEDLPAKSLIGKIALIRRGTCTFAQKVANAQAADAIGVIIYDNEIPTIITRFIDAPELKIPFALIKAEDGELIFDHIYKSKNVAVTFYNETLPFTNPTNIKPEIAAPGGAIFSTYPIKLGSYKISSGTSFAAPYITGCVAILFEAKGKLSADETKKLLMNTAHSIEVLATSNQTATQTSITGQGAGLVNLLDALSSTISISPPKLPLNDTANYKALNTLNVKNSGKDIVKLTVTHVGAQAVSGYNFTESFVPRGIPVYQDSFAEANISESSIVLGPGQSKNIKITIKPPADLDNDSYFIFSGFIISDKAGNKSYSVPYMGMKGIYKTLPILDTAVGAPLILTEDAEIYQNNSQIVTFTLQDVVPADTKVQSNVGELNNRISSAEKSKRSLGRLYRRIPQEDQVTNEQTDMGQTNLTQSDIQINSNLVPDSLGKIATEGVSYYASRNQDAGPLSNYTFIWEGKVDTVDGKRDIDVPNGSHRLVVSVLELYGDERNKKDWEIWVSPRLDIQHS
ncbi:8161_t:CDS:2, partial [Ambispora leptoticha]